LLMCLLKDVHCRLILMPTTQQTQQVQGVLGSSPGWGAKQVHYLHDFHVSGYFICARIWMKGNMKF
jgi:hypothetical protein